MLRASRLILFVGVSAVGAACANGAELTANDVLEGGAGSTEEAGAMDTDGASGSEDAPLTGRPDSGGSVSEDSGGGPGQGEDSSTTGEDAAPGEDGSESDSTAPGQDSSTADAGHDSGTTETDSGTTTNDSEAPDSGTTATDSGTDSGTSTVDAALDDAGCTPSTPTFTPTYFPPATTSGPCSASQAQAFYNDCLVGSTSACNTWIAANASCNTCLQGNTSPAGPDWGPFTEWPLASSETVVELDIGGCLVANGRSKNCAEAFDYLTECEHAACDTTCSGHTFSNYQTCATAADNDQCATYYNDVYVDTSPCSNSLFSTTCLSWTTFEAGFLAIAGVMCE
ncbi:MAG: hypothetical protein ACLQBL_19695 [Polyangiaceae bacterium]